MQQVVESMVPFSVAMTKVRRATDMAHAMTAAIARTPEASTKPVSGSRYRLRSSCRKYI
jgi:hypothetical protein